MSLSICALLFIASAFRQRRSRHALWSVVAAYLAAQEKLSASPVLMACCSLYVLYHLESGRRFAFVKALIVTLRGVGIALATGFFCVVIVRFAGSGVFPRSFVARIVDPFTMFLMPFLRFTAGITDFGEFSYQKYAVMLTIVAMLVYAISLGLLLMRRAWGGPSLSLEPARTGAFLRNVNYPLAAAVFAIGLVATYLVRHHFCYYVTGEPFPFIHSKPFNTTIVFFGATSLAPHLLASIGYAYAVFVNAIPTVFWLALGAVFVMERKKIASSTIPWYGEAVLPCIFAVPFVWGLCQIPVGNRYFNLFLFLFAFAVVLKFGNALSGLPKRWRIVAVTLFISLLVAEIVPFRPCYSAFRPIWSHFSDSKAPLPTLGNPSWVGWGEEVMLASKKIEKLIRSDPASFAGSGKALTLFFFYGGDYLTTSGKTPFVLKYVMKDPAFRHYDVEKELTRLGKVCAKSHVTYEANSLFLVNRYDFVVGAKTFPRSVEPLFTIGYRGYPLAWVFKGDALRTAGISF